MLIACAHEPVTPSWTVSADMALAKCIGHMPLLLATWLNSKPDHQAESLPSMSSVSCATPGCGGPLESWRACQVHDVLAKCHDASALLWHSMTVWSDSLSQGPRATGTVCEHPFETPASTACALQSCMMHQSPSFVHYCGMLVSITWDPSLCIMISMHPMVQPRTGHACCDILYGVSFS